MKNLDPQRGRNELGQHLERTGSLPHMAEPLPGVSPRSVKVLEAQKSHLDRCFYGLSARGPGSRAFRKPVSGLVTPPQRALPVCDRLPAHPAHTLSTIATYFTSQNSSLSHTNVLMSHCSSPYMLGSNTSADGRFTQDSGATVEKAAGLDLLKRRKRWRLCCYLINVCIFFSSVHIKLLEMHVQPNKSQFMNDP